MMPALRAALAALLLLTTTAAADSIRQLRLPTNDIVSDAHSGWIYASVPSRAGRDGNRVAAIEPESGTIVHSVFAGSEPGKLAISDDGRALYVALDGAAAVRRFDLPSLTPGPQFSLGFNRFYNASYLVEDMQVQPGHPEVVAVARRDGHSGGGPTSIFDNGR